MFYHFFPNGTVEKIADAEAHTRMNNISQQWEDENHKLGKLFLGVYDWAFSGGTIHIPNLRTGGRVPANPTADGVFGGDPLYGDCFLKPNNNVAAIDAILAGRNIAVNDRTAAAPKMTYQKMYEHLQKDLATKADAYIKLEKEITQVKGFGDVKEMDRYMKARGEWQEASNNYWGFLTGLKGKDFNPNDEIG